MITLYGIRNCDTVRKARRWLDDNGVDYSFHDLRSDGLDKKTLLAWERELGWEQLLNRRGTTWRKLPESVRNSIGAESAQELMLANPAIIRRPVVDTGSGRHVGFSDDGFTRLFG